MVVLENISTISALITTISTLIKQQRIAVTVHCHRSKQRWQSEGNETAACQKTPGTIISCRKQMKTLRAPLLSWIQSYVPCQVEESKSCNTIHHRLQTASVSEAYAELRLIDITGQTVVSTWPASPCLH